MTLDKAIQEATKRAKRNKCVCFVAYDPDVFTLDWRERYITHDIWGEYAHAEPRLIVYPNGKREEVNNGK